MGLKKDTNRFIKSFTSKFGGFNRKPDSTNSFNMLWFFIIVFIATFSMYAFYHVMLRRK